MAQILIAETIASNVRAEIARAGYSVAKVAAEMGWSKSRMSRRINAEVPFSITELAELAALLGVSMGTFVPNLEAVAS